MLRGFIIFHDHIKSIETDDLNALVHEVATKLEVSFDNVFIVTRVLDQTLYTQNLNSIQSQIIEGDER